MLINLKLIDLKCFEKKITRFELARLLDCNQSTLIQKLKGRRDWKLQDIKKLADVLDVTMQDLLFVNDNSIILSKQQLKKWNDWLIEGSVTKVVNGINEALYGNI